VEVSWETHDVGFSTLVVNWGKAGDRVSVTGCQRGDIIAGAWVKGLAGAIVAGNKKG